MSDDVIPVLDRVPVAPKRIRRGWLYSAIVALAILVAALGLSIPGFAVTAGIGFVMVFAGPIYAAFFVPIAVKKWRLETPDTADSISPERDLIVSFGTLNQKLTMILSGVLVLNLVVISVMSLTTSLDGDYSKILGGAVAVCAGIPIFILNLIWIRSPIAIPAESLAVRNRIGAWRLINANRVLSLATWCGYPAAVIVIAVIMMGDRA